MKIKLVDVGMGMEIVTLNIPQCGLEASLHNFKALPSISQGDLVTSPGPLHSSINDTTAWPL